MGSEIFSNYGPKGNEMFFEAYGFVIEENPNDYFKISLQINSELDDLANKKHELIKILDLKLVHLIFVNDQLPEKLLKVVRIIAANSFELEKIENNKNCDFISTRNELSSMNSLYKIIKTKSDRFKIQNKNGNDLNKKRLGSIYKKGSFIYFQVKK